MDDDADDLATFTEAFRESGFNGKILTFKSGIDLLEYILGLPFSEFPGLILLDLNMPLVDGKKVLKEIKKQKKFVSIPVVIFTTSASDNDRKECYDLGANLFYTKPTLYGQVLDFTSALLSVWGMDSEQSTEFEHSVKIAEHKGNSR